jgi:4-hydroxy-tetrahydrodipicolinate synthase
MTPAWQEGGLPTTIKAGLQLRGFDAGVPRKPLLPLDSADKNELAALIKQLNG